MEISKFVGQSLNKFLKDYVTTYEEHYTIRERLDGCCMFYKYGCQIYPVRPAQCRTYPFWFKNLRSKKNWEQTEKECPGIGQGLHYTKEQILQLLK
jgi:Fe-S-cluster containining protein